MDQLIFVLEMIGTIAFAVSGVIAAKEKEMDLFGAIVLGCTTAVGGGMVRDLILGKTPPLMFTQPVYTEVAFGTSILSFYLEKKHGKISAENLTTLLYIADSVGLGIFAVVGSLAAFDAGYEKNLFLCTFVGTLTGIGGGLLRDMLSAELPLIMRKRVYGLAAVFGALTFSLLMSGTMRRMLPCSPVAVLPQSSVFSQFTITGTCRRLKISKKNRGTAPASLSLVLPATSVQSR